MNTFEKPKIEMAEIFNRFKHLLENITPNQHKIIQAITRCRTHILGGHSVQCGECEFKKNSYNSFTMSTFGPEIFRTKGGKEITLRHCLPEDAGLSPTFQKQIAAETTFTMQTPDNAPSQDKVKENFQSSLDDPKSLRVGAFCKRMIAQFSFRPYTPAHPWTSHIGHFGMMVVQEFWGNEIARRMLEIMDRHAKTSGFHSY